MGAVTRDRAEETGLPGLELEEGMKAGGGGGIERRERLWKVKNTRTWHLQGVWGEKLNKRRGIRSELWGEKKTGEEVGDAA